MPYKVFGKCVHKLKADGSKGEQVKCHEDAASAQKHAKALNANVEEALSLGDIRSQVRAQIHNIVPSGEMEAGPYIVDVFLTYAIVELEGAFFRAPFGSDGATITVAPRNEWKKVTKEWVAQETKRQRVTTTYFAEVIDLSEATLDEENYTVKTAIIRPGWSANQRYYSPDILKAATPLFEGALAYADHPKRSEQKERPERSVRDRVGVFENATWAGKPVANLRLIGESQEWLWPWIKEAVKGTPGAGGVSINALGKARPGEAEGKKGVIVEAIEVVNSVDVVTTPAAGGRFEQLVASGDTFTRDLLNHVSFEEWCEARPEFIERLKKEWQTPRDTKALVAARAECDDARKERDDALKKLAEAERAARTAKADLKTVREARQKQLQESAVDMVLAGSKLPDDWKRALRPQLLEAEDQEAMDAILEAEITKAAAVKSKVPVHGAGRAAPPKGNDRESNPIAESLGATIVAREGESPAEFAARKRKVLESQ